MSKKFVITILSLCLLAMGSYAYFSYYDKKEIPKKVNTDLNQNCNINLYTFCPS